MTRSAFIFIGLAVSGMLAQLDPTAWEKSAWLGSVLVLIGLLGAMAKAYQAKDAAHDNGLQKQIEGLLAELIEERRDHKTEVNVLRDELKAVRIENGEIRARLNE